jgi:Rrf2 family protein
VGTTRCRQAPSQSGRTGSVWAVAPSAWAVAPSFPSSPCSATGGHPTTRALPVGTSPPVASLFVRVSTRGDYASRALLSLALHGAETPTSVRDIAERTGLPQPYLEQILLALKGAGLVRSKRGVGGGYVLARPPSAISLAQIVSAVDGPIAAGDFGEPHADGACDHEGQCVLLAVWADVGETIRMHLQSYSLADMVNRAQGNVAAPV